MWAPSSLLPIMFRLLFILVLTSAIAVQALSPTAANQTCSPDREKLDPITYKPTSDCDPKTFCSSALNNGTCVPRVCRRDAFAFGYASDEVPPPLCGDGMFCPDAGDGCRARAAVGQGCQFGRDEQCAWPNPALGLADRHNANGAVCLKSMCMYANVTEGQACTYELTNYVTTLPENQVAFINAIARDNCLTAHLFCDTQSNVCEPLRIVGQTCRYHRECASYNCVQDLCAMSPDEPFEVATWQFVITGIAIVLAMTATCAMLTIMHKHHRLKKYQETRDYCYEQITLRQSIIALRSGSMSTTSSISERYKKGAFSPF
ncbi:hypothetical protein OF83DRAFT_1140469 [Amylostereum chailletii]|nr:hypothetical protein OF83DRAFT_1140469 [Amylostereum chailletii]